MKVEIWSDVVCPWCYIGKRHFEAALAEFEHRDEIEVVWRSFELDPSGPRTREGDYAGRLARKYGVSVPEAQAMLDRMTGAAAGVGLDFHFELSRPGNTFDAHRLLHLAAERGCQGELKERLLAATFTEGEAIGDRDVLARLAGEVGLDADEVQAVLASDAHAADVRADEQQALDLGVGGVPFFLVAGMFAVSGAQAPDVLLGALRRAWDRVHARPVVVSVGGDAPGCDGDECAI